MTSNKRFRRGRAWAPRKATQRRLTLLLTASFFCFLLEKAVWGAEYKTKHSLWSLITPSSKSHHAIRPSSSPITNSIRNPLFRFAPTAALARSIQTFDLPHTEPGNELSGTGQPGFGTKRCLTRSLAGSKALGF